MGLYQYRYIYKQQKNPLSAEYFIWTTNEIIARIDQFESEMLMRRLIGGSIMLVIATFFFYYTVVFCGIYIHTQRNWIYGCVWSLFWNWVIFAPIYIVVISVLEHKKQDSYNPLVYNLKRLFFF